MAVEQKYMDRFWTKVSKAPHSKGCWEWISTIQGMGYGVMSVTDKGKLILAHRLSWIIHNGEIPSGLCVRHFVCDNPLCVNPEHLKLGTKADNSRDMVEKGRSVKGSKNWKSIFKETDVIDIRSRIAKGDRGIDIARDYKTTPSAISDIKCGTNWSWLKEPAQ